ncbi:MAG: hypothetical protein ACI9YE_003087, partial [Psychroserpens sp.]
LVKIKYNAIQMILVSTIVVLTFNMLMLILPPTL